jgi:hypothetical protein
MYGCELLNIVFIWLHFLFYVQDITGSNLNLETDSLMKNFCGFSQSLQADANIVPEISP